MAEEPRKDIDQLTVAELRARASELEITGRSAMNKAELRQAVIDAEVQLGQAAPGPDWQADDEDVVVEAEAKAEAAAEAAPAPALPGAEERGKHVPSSVDAMGLDKRRAVMGKRYGASFAKQATVYGVFLVIVVALVIGGKLAADELDKGPEVNPDEAPWSAATAEQHPPTDVDFPRSVTP